MILNKGNRFLVMYKEIVYKTRYYTKHAEHATYIGLFEPFDSILSQQDFPIRSVTYNDVTNALMLLVDVPVKHHDEKTHTGQSPALVIQKKIMLQVALFLKEFITNLEVE